MKNIVLAIVSTIIGVLTLMLVMTVYGRINRSMELQSNLSSVVEETVENMALNPKYSIQNTNEFLADLTENLVFLLDSKSDISIYIQQCDKEKGILSVKVELAYTHPNGNEGGVSCEKTVIINRLPETVKTAMYKVTFCVGADLYKEYMVEQGSMISAPAEPQCTEGTFYGWIDANGYLADFTQPVTQDVTFWADVR